MSIYTKKIDQISLDDINAFFNQRLREGLRIDYKAEFPTNTLAKIITAFANTSGGVALIGVRANRETNIPEQITGVPLDNALEERVINIATSNVRPQVSLEVAAIPYKSNALLPANDRAIVIVRIPESNFVPHYDSDNAIWVRNHNVCNQASIDVIEKLLERRNRGTNLPLQEILQSEALAIAISGFPTDGGRRRYFSIIISPAYSFKINLTKSIDDFIRTQTSAVDSINEETPKIRSIELRSRNQTTREIRRCFIFTQDAFFLFAAPFESTNGGTGIFAERVIQMLAKMMRASVIIFKHFDYFGRLSIKTSLTEITGMQLANMIPMTQFDDEPPTAAGDFSIERSYSIDELESDELNILGSFYNELLRGFQVTLEESAVTIRLNYLITHLPTR
jgi:hypothetical protein